MHGPKGRPLADRSLAPDHVPDGRAGRAVGTAESVHGSNDALARGKLALGVLGVDALLPPALAGSGALALELFENLLHDELLG